MTTIIRHRVNILILLIRSQGVVLNISKAWVRSIGLILRISSVNNHTPSGNNFNITNTHRDPSTYFEFFED